MKQKTKKAFSFLQNTIKDSFSKFHYYECAKKGMHNGQKLTYVCINKHCQERGLICSICRVEHASHDADVIPLKNLLSQIAEMKDTLPKQYGQDMGTRQYLEALEDKKNQLLHSLKQTVEQLAQHFQKLEQEIINQFRQTKINLLNQIGSNRNLKKQIQELLDNINGDLWVFQKGVHKISAVVQRTGNKNEIDFKNNLPQIIKHYQTYTNQQILKVTQILNINQSLFLDNTIPKLQPYEKIVPTTQLQNNNPTFAQNTFLKETLSPKIEQNSKFEEDKSAKQPTSYTFSTLLKSNTILVEKNGSVAKQTKNASVGRFIMVSEGVGLKKQQISFKITRLSNWIGLGICIRDKIMKGKYGFQYQKLGHGSYMLSSNGFTWSHSDITDNIINHNFLFGEGQIIDVYLSEKQLKFVKRTSQKSLQLKINMNKTQWNNACFCVNLCDAQDKVQIVSSPS